jgi:hypothetical protein
MTEVSFGRANYDDFLAPHVVVLGVLAIIVFGAIPGMVLGPILGLLVGRLLYAGWLTHGGARDSRLAEFTPNGRLVMPVPSLIALAVLIYGLVTFHFARANPEEWMSFLGTLPPWLSGDGSAAAASLWREWADHLMRVSAALTGLGSVFLTWQLARAYAHGWSASGVVFNTGVALDPIEFQKLFPVRVLLVVGAAGFSILTIASVQSEYFIDPVTGPYAILTQNGGLSDAIPLISRYSLVGMIAFAWPWLLSMTAGLLATVLWRLRYGPTIASPW